MKCSDTVSENFAFAIFVHDAAELALVWLNQPLKRQKEDGIIFGFAPYEIIQSVLQPCGCSSRRCAWEVHTDCSFPLNSDV